MDRKKENIEWLKTVEQNSWQIELLISGGLLLSLYHVPDLINNWLTKVVTDSQLTTSIILIFFMTLIVSKALLIGFGFNLLLRASWLASLGIHYAFPHGINYEELNYHPDITEDLKSKYSPTEKVLLLEKLSSLSYSVAIIFTLFSIGAMLITLMLYVAVFEPFLPSDIHDSKLFGFAVLGLVVLLSLGAFEHIANKRRLSILQSFNRMLSFFNLTFLFKTEWLVLTSNIKRWKLYLTCFIYFGIAIVLSLNDISWSTLSLNLKNPLDHRDYTEIGQPRLALQNNEYEEYYEKGEYVGNAVIPSELIKDNFLKIFIPYDEWFDISLKHLIEIENIAWNPQDFKDVDITENYNKIQLALNKTLVVKIDGSVKDSIRWHMRAHPNNDQLGFSTFVDIKSLNRGHHQLQLFYNIHRPTTIDTFSLRYIPFWKDSPIE